MADDDINTKGKAESRIVPSVPVYENDSLKPVASKEIESKETGQQESFTSFDPRNISAERIGGLIFTGFVGLAMIVGGLVLFFSVGLGWVFYLCLAAAILFYACLLWFTIFWPGIEHRHRGWRLSDAGLEVRHGVWWKHLHAVPWARVQHADVVQGPIQRMCGVGTLTVHTAGTSNSSVNLSGLSHPRAIELRDEIIRQRTLGDVV